MVDTTFVDETSTVPGTLIEASWLNAINDFFYTLFAAAATAGDARTALGLGTIATQASNNVTITGGSVTGITDLAVADGGTGASTAAAARLSLGAIGNLLSSQEFTASGTWNKPANCKYIRIEAVGPGGGGGGVDGDAANGANGAGGGSGGYGITPLLDVTSIATGTITFGSVGAGGAAGANDGTAGGNTTWSDGTNSFTWGGGGGGQGIAASASLFLTVGGVSGTVSGTGLVGGGKKGGYCVRGILSRLGNGADSIWGIGGILNASGADGIDGSGYGSGGSGANASSASATNYAGGDGAPSRMVVWEYY